MAKPKKIGSSKKELARGLRIMSQLSDTLTKTAIATNDAKEIQDVVDISSKWRAEILELLPKAVPDYIKPHINVLDKNIKQLNRKLAKLKELKK